ncbi:hypothetical protein [Candidatus Sororendozoicomonas aggregata]|uniref:hypothetical protein n=1 Tax=Candidatus Sororendozoicomonas aggregata TaxID=3073239 RepID=UPI002ED13BBC
MISKKTDIISEYKKNKYSASNKIEQDVFLNPISCAKLRKNNQYTFEIPSISEHSFLKKSKQLKISKDCILHWVNSENGDKIKESCGLEEHLYSIDYCSERSFFLRKKIDLFSPYFEEEISLIARFISSIVWLTSDDDDAEFGSASFYEMPHCTFFSDAALFFVPPYIQIEKGISGIAIIENMYHEALHHQMHSHCFNNKISYGKNINPYEETVYLPQRKDRKFTYFQAINALHVYHNVVKFREKAISVLNKIDIKNSSKLPEKYLNKSVEMKHFLYESLLREKRNLSKEMIDMINQWR